MLLSVRHWISWGQYCCVPTIVHNYAILFCQSYHNFRFKQFWWSTIHVAHILLFNLYYLIHLMGCHTWWIWCDTVWFNFVCTQSIPFISCLLPVLIYFTNKPCHANIVLPWIKLQWGWICLSQQRIIFPNRRMALPSDILHQSSSTAFALHKITFFTFTKTNTIFTETETKTKTDGI